ncbi:MAG: M23 family metallopeptidase [Tannerellaceae bacterium]|jgi:lipoprotein NlpD|nr:M23 family metallopeptidase [Tannerellaceae bacterium]
MAKQGRRDFQAFWRKIRFKYKLSFFNEGTLEEVWSFRLSQLSAFSILFAFALLLVIFTSVIIITTPIRNYLPGYLDVEVRKDIMQNALRADSLERIIYMQGKYLSNVVAILSGTMPVDTVRRVDSASIIKADYNIPRSEKEEDFVRETYEKEKYNLTALNPTTMPTNVVFFYKPVKGVVSSGYDASKNHFGIDLVGAPRENVFATLDGTVIFTGFDPQFGNIIQLQHRGGFVSIYKHNELLLKRMGDKVIAGEAIAIIGNTGELSTGPHLHFELWHNGIAVNPEEYISF